MNIKNIDVFYEVGKNYIQNTEELFSDVFKDDLIELNIKFDNLKFEFISKEAIHKFIGDTICWYEVKFPDNQLFINDGKLNLEEHDYSDNSKVMTMKQFKSRLSIDIDALLGGNVDAKAKATYDIIINYIVNMVTSQLTFSKDTRPEYGYFRAVMFIRDFNKEYGFGISANYLSNMINKNYSVNSPEYVTLNKKNSKSSSTKKRILKRRHNYK